jgi:hypothetical protein
MAIGDTDDADMDSSEERFALRTGHGKGHGHLPGLRGRAYRV